MNTFIRIMLASMCINGIVLCLFELYDGRQERKR
jgi:hypothetical protein